MVRRYYPMGDVGDLKMRTDEGNMDREQVGMVDVDIAGHEGEAVDEDDVD